jgi:hypothetical protein
MPPVFDRALTGVGGPHHDMRCARADFMIAARATVGLGCTRAGNGTHFVLVAVGPDLHSPDHQNNRNSSLSMPRIRS